MWLSQYIETFFSSPIATLVFSLGVLLTSLHLIIPAVLQVGVSLFNFWDRGENLKRNPYIKWLNKGDKANTRKSGGVIFHLKQVKDCNTHDLGASIRSNLDVYSEHWIWMSKCGRSLSCSGDSWESYAGPSQLRTSKEHAMEVGTGSSYMVDLGMLLFGTVGATMLSWVADWLLFSYFIQTVVILLVVGSVCLALFGGRFVFDLNKKVDKVSQAETKEE